ncbi:MAG: hypothetical protein E6K62_03045 [Nitrospirae bacterium]|nr:MAG: hypothetical protein E6K62_03045 [Nitrospirota bacterium]
MARHAGRRRSQDRSGHAEPVWLLPPIDPSGHRPVHRRLLLRGQRGFGPARIESVNLCTACHPDLFYSYRREGAGTGRMISGIGFTVMLS